MNLFEIYEAALQQAEHNNTTLDADYLQDYVSGVNGDTLTSQTRWSDHGVLWKLVR